MSCLQITLLLKFIKVDGKLKVDGPLVVTLSLLSSSLLLFVVNVIFYFSTLVHTRHNVQSILGIETSQMM